jgi:serine/threonine protein kinase
MTSSREEDERVMEILLAARRKPAAEREAYLRTACAGDENLRREVADSLSWEERMGGFLEQPVAMIANESLPRNAARTAAVRFPTGLEIGQYRIESKLGEGGMSTVWLALDTRLNRRVAIKFLSDDLADPDARRRFQREAQMASSLNHPHIITVYDIGEFEGRQYLVTEYVDGGTLKGWIKTKQRTPQEIAELMTGVADGLAAAHQAGILHRDIKPLNIFVARNGYAKLADFGLAKLAESNQFDLAPHLPEAHTRQGLILGTIAYMSPEQASGQPLDSRSDIFSFGVVLYEMLSGKRPFGGRTDLEVLKTIIHGEFPPMAEELPEAYRNVVKKALEKSPAERYQSMREMVVDLRQAQRSQRSHFPLSATLPPGDAGFAIDKAITQIEPKRGPIFHKTWLKIVAGIFAVIAFGAAGVYRGLQPRHNQEQTNLNVVPFTALAGQATSPAFSPDGSRIAFAWNGDPKGGAKGFDLYVKALGSETLLRLTQHPSEWISPTWSPDGAQIAFHRMAGTDSGIYVVPALGGPERKLRSTRIPWGQFALIPFSLISWSPNGKWIAFSDVLPEGEPGGIKLLSTETLETKPILAPTECERQGAPSFSHDGEYLGYWCVRAAYDEAALYSLALPDGKPKMIATFRGLQYGLTWSADDKKLIYSLWNYASFELREVTVKSGSTNLLAFAGAASLPTVSPRGDKLAFTTSNAGLSGNIWRRDLLHHQSPAVELIPSSRGQGGAQYSPDGKRIVFASLRSGVQGVWISNEDGSNLMQVSNPAQPSGSPQWSPDGNKIAFDSLQRGRWEIYLAGATEGIPKKVVTNMSDLIRPHWSRDGQWIYFSSREPGRMGIYRCPAAGGDAVVLSADMGGLSPQESFDGSTVYFASHEQPATLKKVLLGGLHDTELEVAGVPRLRHSSLWTLAPTGIYFVPDDAPRSLRYFDFNTKQTRSVFELDKDFGGGLSVSPDGRWILYSQVGDESSDIVLVEHFH